MPFCDEISLKLLILGSATPRKAHDEVGRVVKLGQIQRLCLRTKVEEAPPYAEPLPTFYGQLILHLLEQFGGQFDVVAAIVEFEDAVGRSGLSVEG